ncbi:unnamed protein product [Rhizoctonia solani]|uniref:Uncharacterized protein n=1 Tax=Rhizoctonia solani TaxID=456999 RepID=A0A8H3E0B7_9AGAM|nr:unnamed protein product [Rhizoctonia solani]
MSSQYPSGDRDKRGVRQKLKSGAKWLKNVVGRPSNVRPSSENPEDLTIPNLGSRSLSISRPSTPLLAPTVAPIEPDPRIEVGPDAEASNTTAREPKKPDSVAWNRLANSLRILESGVQIFPPLKSAIGALIGRLDIVQKAASSRADYDDLADEFQSMAELLSRCAGELELEPSNGSIANIAQQGHYFAIGTMY